MGLAHTETVWVGQVVRKQLFEAGHHGVQICHLGAGRPWEGVISMLEARAETVTAFELKHLLDQLETLAATRGDR